MARPKKEKTQETPSAVSEPIKEVLVVPPLTPEVVTPVVPAPVITSKVSNKTSNSKKSTAEPSYWPPADNDEMSRYFRVIYNSEAASRISGEVTRQRDLNLWGVHQYNDSSRNSYARSFYFRDQNNALAAVRHAQKLTTE
jgi:hypothetical protein